MKKTLTLLAIALCAASGLRAQQPGDSAAVMFRQSSIILQDNYKDNGRRIDSIVERISKKLGANDVDGAFSSVSIIGAASPEGPVKFNRYLAEHRAEAIREAVASRITLPDSLVNVTALGSDWKGLREAVANDGDVPYRDEVVALLDSIIAETPVPEPTNSRNLELLKRLRGGEPYRYLYKNIFPSLRQSRIVINYPLREAVIGGIAPLTIAETDMPALPAPELLPLMTPMADPCRPFYMGLKTNLLYDAAALPSIGAEFYLGKNWSIAGNWTYGWWDTDSRHRYWRAYGGDLAVRRWFGRKAEEKPLTGHHLGLYAGVVTYDFEFGGRGYMGGLPGKSLWDRCNFMAGIEYGYSLPIARRLNLDFTIGVGYLGGKVIEYVPDNGFYRWEKTRRLTWIGPTKLEVSLVWLIGCDNFNRRGHSAAEKGGLR